MPEKAFFFKNREYLKRFWKLLVLLPGAEEIRPSAGQWGSQQKGRSQQVVPSSSVGQVPVALVWAYLLSLEDVKSHFSLVLCMKKVPVFKWFLISEQSWKEFAFQESLIMVDLQKTKRNFFFFFTQLSGRRKIKSNFNLGRRNPGRLKCLSGFNRLMPLSICKDCFDTWSFKAL